METVKYVLYLIMKRFYLYRDNKEGLKVLGTLSTLTNKDHIDGIEHLLKDVYINNTKNNKCIWLPDEINYVIYKNNNHIYSICVNGLFFKKYDTHRNIMNMIIEATLVNDDNIFFKTQDITELLKEYQGPFFDFHENFNGVSFNLKNILKGRGIDVHNYKKLNITTVVKHYSHDISEYGDNPYYHIDVRDLFN